MDERNNNFDFDFKPIGQAIKKALLAKEMTLPALLITTPDICKRL